MLKESCTNEELRWYLKDLINNVKKKVFDDIEKIINNKDRIMKDGKLFYAYLQEDFQELKERHLSTFQKEKRHNNDLIIKKD